MKKVIVIYDDKKEKLISLAIDEDYIEDIEYIKNRPIPEWFPECKGRDGWDGFIKVILDAAGCSKEDLEFVFYGGKDSEEVFKECIQREGIAYKEEVKNPESDMKANKIVAKKAWDSGKNKEGLRQYKIIAKYENNKEFQYFLADYYYKEYLNQEEEKEEELLKESLKYYKIAARNQHVEAQYKLFEIYSNGEIIEKDNQEAIKWLKESAEQGYAEAQNDLGIYCRDESKFGKKLAFGWSEKAARQGYAEAQTNVGECYKEGLGVERNTQRAFYWFNEAAKKGVARAQYYMGECYKNDEGVCRDFVKAVEYYRKAAEQGYMEAQYELGRCYEIGLGLPSDRYQASKWYLKAAERGHAEAQYYLGKYYENLENWEMAIKWYQKPAEHGNPEVQCCLGRCYDKNKQGKEALEWYGKSAEQGYAKGEYYYGCNYWRKRFFDSEIMNMEAKERVEADRENFEIGRQWVKKAADNPRPSIDACLKIANGYYGEMDELFGARNAILFGSSILIPVANTITIPVAIASAIASRKLSKSHFLKSDEGKEMIKYYQRAARLGSNEAQEKLESLGYSW